MTDQEMNAAIAQALGWHTIQPNPLNRKWLAGFRKNDNTALLGIPDYPTNANTRAEMLASLTFTEKADICNQLFDGEEDGSEDFMVKILELNQPTFARLFCQVKGLMRAEKAEGREG